MSLKHAFTDLIADDPALPTFVRPSNWNEEHVFPGAGAGEVVYVDGDGHAATSADLTFDAVSKTLTVGGPATGGSLVVGYLSYLFGDPTPGTLQLGSPNLLFDTSINALSIGTTQYAPEFIASQVDYAINAYPSSLVMPTDGNDLVLNRNDSNNLTFTAGDSGFVVNCEGSLSFSGFGDFSINSGNAVWTFLGNTTGALISDGLDIGASDAPMGQVYANGYNAGATPGFTGTISAADLTTQDINVVGGIIVGLV